MNLPLYSSISARLADGSETLLSVHLGTIVWDNVDALVPILASGYKPLLGTAIMEGNGCMRGDTLDSPTVSYKGRGRG
jgi:predicted aspartyl protease